MKAGDIDQHRKEYVLRQLAQIVFKSISVDMSKLLIKTVPFADKAPRPLQLLEQAGIEYLVNPYNRKLTDSDLITD